MEFRHSTPRQDLGGGHHGDEDFGTFRNKRGNGLTKGTGETGKSAVPLCTRWGWCHRPRRKKKKVSTAHGNGHDRPLRGLDLLFNIRHRGVSGLDAASSILNTGSSRGVSGCTSNLFSQSAADDFDGSNPAGSESEPAPRCCQLGATIWEATSVGTIANNPDLKMRGQSVIAVLRMT